jgi:hypothetical protein
VGAGPAAASVTVGQVAPGAVTSCSTAFDFLQVSTPDNSYTLPTGVITSWTHRSQAGSGQQVILKIFRKTADPARYQVVGLDGPHPVTQNTTTSFPANLAVKAGDVLGISGAGGLGNIGCFFAGPGSIAFRNGNLPNGGDGDFTVDPSTNKRLNLSAVVTVTNSFTVGAVARNKKKGTATVTATLPNAGELILAGNGVKAAAGARASATVAAPGDVQVVIQAQGKKKRKLVKTGKVKLNATLTYTPTGGDAASQSVAVTLKKKTKK